jgi:Fe-S-cluster containining protein
MELSSNDIKRLEKAGYRREEFAVIDDDVIRLRNINGRCYFYSLADKKCRVYGKRPLGCYLYPVVYLVNESAIVDELCPMDQTISEQELRTKGKILVELLKKLDNERGARLRLLMQVDTDNKSRQTNRANKKIERRVNSGADQKRISTRAVLETWEKRTSYIRDE